MKSDILLMLSAIEQTGIAPLRAAFTIAVSVFLVVGTVIWRKRHKLFDRDPEVDNDVPTVRHNREELITMVWAGLTLVLMAIAFQVWRA